MAQMLGYITEEIYNGNGFDDNAFHATNSHRNHVDEFSDSDFEDDSEENDAKSDTSALEARNGKDIQGIPWERFNFTRDDYREKRLSLYKNYENLARSRKGLTKEFKEVKKGHSFYDFQFNTRIVRATVVHFQMILGMLFTVLSA